MAYEVTCLPSDLQYTPEHLTPSLLTITPYRDSGLSLGYESDSEDEEDFTTPEDHKANHTDSNNNNGNNNMAKSVCHQNTSLPESENSAAKDTEAAVLDSSSSTNTSGIKSSSQDTAPPLTCITQNNNNNVSKTTTMTSSSVRHFPPQVAAKLRRKFKKSRSDKLLRTVLKRAQNKVNKQLFPPQEQPAKKLSSPPRPSADCFAKAKDYMDLKYISGANLSRLLKLPKKDENTSYSLIDCRLPVEFNKGNMAGSINLHSRELVHHFFTMYNNASHRPNALVFYSHHVIDESLRMAYFIRTLDLRTNTAKNLTFPTIYLLNESFRSFQKHFPALCQSCTAL